MQLTNFNTLTFDCYGTLIDWETGIFESLMPWLEREGITATRDEVLELFAHYESAEESANPKMLYPDLLARVHKDLAQHWGVQSTDEDASAFGASVGKWPAFPDSASALHYLKQHYKLVILSNVDRASFAESNKKLEVEFDAIFTAQDIGSYKPDLANFEYMLAKLAQMGIEKSQILHTAQSLFHDHVPATKMGLATCWIDRRHNQEGWGATAPPPADATINFHMNSMAEFVRQHGGEALG